MLLYISLIFKHQITIILKWGALNANKKKTAQVTCYIGYGGHKLLEKNGPKPHFSLGNPEQLINQNNEIKSS